jgi:hypothetical protein
MGNTYRYGIHESLSPGGLLLFVTIDETCKQLGIEDFATVGAILAGQNGCPLEENLVGPRRGPPLRRRLREPI